MVDRKKIIDSIITEIEVVLDATTSKPRFKIKLNDFAGNKNLSSRDKFLLGELKAYINGEENDQIENILDELYKPFVITLHSEYGDSSFRVESKEDGEMSYAEQFAYDYTYYGFSIYSYSDGDEYFKAIKNL